MHFDGFVTKIMPGGVLVQPSFYGTDNACMLDAVAELGEHCGRPA
jgi:predicted TIM-barrel fold metal-dependent hydrolase